MLYLDCKDNSYELIPTNPNMKPYKIAVFFSGLEHSLAGSKYNMRVDELRSGIYALQAFAGLDYGKFNEANARDVSYEVYQTYKDKLPVQWAKRCEHWYTEFKRVEAGAKHGGEAIWMSMDACPLNPVGAVSITGNPEHRSRSSCMKLCGKLLVSMEVVSVVPVSRAAVWR